MGRSYWFECPKCGYRAKVSGRADRGLNLFVQTICCQDCKELYDAVTRLRVADGTGWPNELGRWRIGRPVGATPRITKPPSFQAALNRLFPSGVKRFRWLPFKPQCPVSAWHRVRGWNDPGKCPKCGIYLEKGALPYRIWD